jgi:hypothetical protein
MDSRYSELRKEFEEVFSTYLLIKDSHEEFISPSGLYKLQILTYEAPEKRTWNCSRGIVTRQSDGKVIAAVKRNYGIFWHAWAEHPNGHEYLLCGEDYQGYSIVNLNLESYQVYFPEEAYEGQGFCWTAVYPSPDRLVLAVEGCYWACPYDVVFYDFQTPDKLPYKELDRISEISSVEGWIDNRTCQIQQGITFRKNDGARYDELSEIEQTQIDNGEVETEYQNITVQVTRPAFDETG